ncbi:hypothetical protein IW136_005832, partial [Coemansia sp. RSA 678]
DISGMMTPWIYVGMCFSTFCWHNEDHYTFSVNYQHWGDTKTWYGVPGRHADKFEDTMRAAMPELFAEQPDLLFQLVTMMSPDVLLRRGVDVVTCDQRAGEFVVTFPQSYHAGFNHGFNFNEAVNFATPDWMPFGIASVKRYRQHARNPVFSHDELIMTMCESDAAYLTEPWFQRAAAEMLVRERNDRARVRAMWPSNGTVQRRMNEADWDSVVSAETDIPEDTRQQCIVCKAFSFLSAVICDCSPNYVSCLLHAEKACKCSGHHKTLVLRYTDSELDGMFSLCRDEYQPEPEPEVKPSDDSNGGSKAQIWEDEFRRVMALYSGSADEAHTTITAVSSGTPAKDNERDDDSMGTAQTVSDDFMEVVAAEAEKAASVAQKLTPPKDVENSVRGTMTVADLNRRPDLAQMVLLLEEAQRLV